jgi:(p)ppGpp synthase/HD superfamily hydrolase
MTELRRPLSNQFEAALNLAHRVHRHQARKGSGGTVPYIAHVLAVTALVLENGGTETQTLGALLHDAIEDAPDPPGCESVTEEIRDRFGPEVLLIVEDCSDARGALKAPWRERKMAYVAHIAVAAPESLLVSAADKLHNVRAILRDYRVVGDDVWRLFKPEAGRAGTLGYYRALTEAFRARLKNPIVGDLDRELMTLEQEAGGRCGWPPA